MTSLKELMAVCPYVRCGKVIFRKAETIIKTDTPNAITFETKCPHCQQLVKINISVEIKVDPIW